jgi:hypothetical protein
MASKTILDLDLRKILTRVEERYAVRLPRTVLAVDYGELGDLYLSFKHIERPVGEASKDGLVIFFYEGNDGRVVAIEILDQAQLMRK